MTSNALVPLLKELDAWSLAGRDALFWWRDDDAAHPCPELDELLNMTNRYGAPCGLAAIPARVGEPLARRLESEPLIWILQHGLAHVNHAPKGNGAWELGLHRPLPQVLADLRQGRDILSGLFGKRFVPVVVPPWNRMDPALWPELPGLGIRGVSAGYRRSGPTPPPGVRVVGVPCDLLDWESGLARFSGETRCVADLVEHLQRKRTGEHDPLLPSGILTHHLEMDRAAWNFFETLATALARHPAARWAVPPEIWPEEART